MKEQKLGKLYFDNQVIFKEGEKGEVMYVIQSGKVKISKSNPSGEVPIAILGSGDILGEMALFDKLSRSATARASGETRILSVDKKKLFASISRDPTLVLKIIETMSQRIRGLNDSLTKLKKNKIYFSDMSIGLEEACTSILEEAKNLIMAENGSVMLLNESGESLHIAAAFGIEADSKVKLSPGEGIAGDVLKTGKAELVNNVSLDSRYKKGSIQIRSMMCVPMKYDGRILGVINMSNSAEKLFTFEDLKAIYSLGVHASIAVHNSKVFSKLIASTDEVLVHAEILDMCSNIKFTQE